MKTIYSLIVIVLVAATIGCQVNNTPKIIEIYFYHGTSAKPQPELINVVSQTAEVEELYVNLTGGRQTSFDIAGDELLDSCFFVYQLSYEKNSVVTKRRHILVLRTPVGDFAQDIDFGEGFYFDEYSLEDNSKIIDLVRTKGWRKAFDV